MKRLLLISFAVASVMASAQNNVTITSAQYNALKSSGQLDVTKNYIFSDANANINSGNHHYGGMKSPSSICSCMIPLDTTFSTVPFMGGAPPDYRNDDGSAGITIPFNFNLYGTNYSTLYINNNGNVSFGSSYATFISTSFPNDNYEMIAPFWADVNTTPTTSGLVYYRTSPTNIIIKWDSVQAFGGSAANKNTFQLILTDGTDPLLPPGVNVGFCYGDIQWSGAAGPAGPAATVGVNKGDSINYFQVGRFTGAGTAFDGPYGSNDGIDWLDNQGVYFNAAASGNIPPVIINNNICDTIDVFTGDTTLAPFVDSVEFMLRVSTPEIDQTVTATFSSSDMANLAYTLTTNTPTYKEYTCKFYVAGLPAGLHSVTVTATDDGVPAASANRTVLIRSNYDAGLATSIKEYNSISNISIYPNPTESLITVKHNFNVNANPVLTITNLVGQSIMTQSLSNNEQGIDISKLSKGIYFATIISNEGKSKTIKVVKK